MESWWGKPITPQVCIILRGSTSCLTVAAWISSRLKNQNIQKFCPTHLTVPLTTSTHTAKALASIPHTIKDASSHLFLLLIELFQNSYSNLSTSIVVHICSSFYLSLVNEPFGSRAVLALWSLNNQRKGYTL